MSYAPSAVWVNVSPSLRRFNQPLLRTLSKHVLIAEWQYCHSLDESCSLDIAVDMLQDYLRSYDYPVHLIGHSTGGLLGLLYAQSYPNQVKSLSLLSVGVQPAVDWQAHYYTQRQMMPCSRQMLLTRMVFNLFGWQPQCMTEKIAKLLEQDLVTSLSPHNLFKQTSILPAGVPMPLLVCGGEQDLIVSPPQLQGWQSFFKSDDRLWQCPNGCHFFHYFNPEIVAEQILNFWNSLISEIDFRPYSKSPLNL